MAVVNLFYPLRELALTNGAKPIPNVDARHCNMQISSKRIGNKEASQVSSRLCTHKPYNMRGP